MNPSSKIYIIGAGAIGKALAVILKRNNRNVFLLRASVDDTAPHNELIKVILPNNKVLAEQVMIESLSNSTTLNGIIILTNKSYGNERISELLKQRKGNSSIVIMQNGLGVERPFLNDNYPEVYRCVLFSTCQLLVDNVINFKPISSSPIGIIKSNKDSLDEIVESLNNPTFPFKIEHQIENIVWMKTIINCVFNTICPLLEVDNGIFHRNPEALNLAIRVLKECISIAELKGIYISENEIRDKLLEISKGSDGQLISTLQDIRNRKETEIDTLNLEIARIAKSLNTRVDFTQWLGELTKLKSQISMAGV